MMKKILHISKYYYPYVGGVEVTAQYLAEGLDKYENRVLCFNTKYHDHCDMINGVQVNRAGSFMQVARQSISFTYYSFLKKLIKEYKPDFIHLHCPNPFVYPLLLLLLPGSVKLVLHWHLDIINQKRIYPFIRWVEKLLLERADRILVTSPNYKESSRPLYPYLDKVRVLQSAIATQQLDLQPNDSIMIESIKRKYNNRRLIFFVGRHIEYKGLKYLIESELFIQNDCCIIIAGAGPLTEELKSKASEKRIYFIGHISKELLRCYLHVADIFAFPSITKNEAFGLALVEAMYCECVPVTFYIEGSGVNWVSLNQVTGIEVPVVSAKMYAEAIDTLLSNNLMRIQYGKAARKRVIEMFTVEKEIYLASEIYKELESLRS